MTERKITHEEAHRIKDDDSLVKTGLSIGLTPAGKDAVTRFLRYYVNDRWGKGEIDHWFRRAIKAAGNAALNQQVVIYAHPSTTISGETDGMIVKPAYVQWYVDDDLAAYETVKKDEPITEGQDDLSNRTGHMYYIAPPRFEVRED